MTRSDSDAYMSLTRHLLELRARLLLSLAGILVGAIGAWFLYTPATTWLTRPLASAGASGINFRTIIGPFSTHITFALWAGFILTTPWWLTQLWLFIAPALTRTEKRRTDHQGQDHDEADIGIKIQQRRGTLGKFGE